MTASLEPSRRPAGYVQLVDRYQLDVIPNWRRSYVAETGTHRFAVVEGVAEETYTPQYWPGDSLGEQLEFALKYDGTNLGILAALFNKLPSGDIAELLRYVRSKPVGKYARRIWYLYELLTGDRLALDDLTKGNYEDLLDPEEYYTTNKPLQVRRQRIKDNLLGDGRFCPTIRRTDTLCDYEAADLVRRCRDIVAAHSPEMLGRAVGYLYTKETKSSFAIEHIQPSASRTERFIALLQSAEQEDFCERERLIALQNAIVEPRFRETGYRTVQNYVGQTTSWQRELIHYAGPKPEDVEDLMAGLFDAHRRMQAGGVSAVASAAAVSYGFVFVHPFEDGNGRIHRFLIHNVLARRGFTPEGMVFPVSAAMLRAPRNYDASLKAFSRPLMRTIDYTLDEEGRMTVESDTAHWYRYIDLTPQVEALYSFIERAIDTELVEELQFLERYDAAARAIREVVDMPDRLMDLFIRFCLQNRGRLAARNRTKHFDFLSDDEVARLERAVQQAYYIE